MARLEESIRVLQSSKVSENVDEIVVAKQRQISELTSELHDTKAELDRILKRKVFTEVHMSQIRDQYSQNLRALSDRVCEQSVFVSLFTC